MASPLSEKEVGAVGPVDGTVGGLPGARLPPRPHHPSSTTALSPGSLMVESVDDAEGLYVAVERCPLCNTARRRLTCARCIQSGDFVYFDGRNPERLVWLFVLFTLPFNIYVSSKWGDMSEKSSNLTSEFL